MPITDFKIFEQVTTSLPPLLQKIPSYYIVQLKILNHAVLRTTVSGGGRTCDGAGAPDRRDGCICEAGELATCNERSNYEP